MGELTAYGSQITSVFQLIGTLENDITKSIAWAFCQCSSFSKHVFDELFSIHCNPDNIMITYQQWEAKKGITDLEITDNDLFYVIIEAKRGWVLPGPEQLTLYSERKSFTDSQAKNKAIITMSECSDVFADTYLPSDLIQHITEAGGPTPFAANILKNNQLSGRVLKAEVCLNLAKYLKYLHVETMEDFKRFEFPELLETVIHSVKGMGDAGTNYLFMLAGDPNRCKPDVHIHHCIKDACGEDISNDDCQLLFSEAVQELKHDYPYLTVAKLDGIIWRKYQGAKHKKIE